MFVGENGDVLTSSGHKETLMNFSGVFYRDDDYVFITRENDILIEVNGVNVEKIKHQDVVDKIR